MRRRWSESVDAYVRRGVVVCCDKNTAHEERVAVHMTAALHIKATLHGGGGGASMCKPVVDKGRSLLCCGKSAVAAGEEAKSAEDVKLILPNWKEEANDISQPNNAASLALSVAGKTNIASKSKNHAIRIIEKFSHRKTTNLNLYSEIAALAACHDKEISQNLVKAVAHKLSKKLENPLVPLRTLEFIVMNIPKDHYDAYVMNQIIDIMTDIKGKLADSDEAIAGAMTSCFISVLYCMYLSGCRGMAKEKYDSLKADHTATLFENAQNIFKQSPSSKAEAARNKLVLEILKRIGDNEDPLLKNLKIGGELALGMIDIGMGVFSMDISLVVSGLSTVVSAADKIDIQKKWFELYTLFRLTYPSGMEEVKNAWKETTDKMTGTIDESAAYSIIDYMHDRSHYVSEEQKKVIAKDLDELSKLEMWPTVAPRINLYIGTIKEQIYPPTPPSEEEGASNAKSEKKGPDPFPKALFEETRQADTFEDIMQEIKTVTINHSDYKRLADHVTLLGKYADKGQSAAVSEMFQEFFKSDVKVMLLAGSRGSGKTSTLKRELLRLYEQWGDCNQDKNVAFYHRLGKDNQKYPSVIGTLLKEVEKNGISSKYMGFSKDQMPKLKADSRLAVFFLDDFNLLDSNDKSIWESNNMGSWKNVKLVIACDKDRVLEREGYQKCFASTNSRGNRGRLTEVFLQPLNDELRSTYFKGVASKQGQEKWREGRAFEDALSQGSDLLQLAELPSMLRLLEIVLPRYSDDSIKYEPPKNMSKESATWDKIIEIWMEVKILETEPESLPTAEDRRALFTKAKKAYVKDICFLIIEAMESEDLETYFMGEDEFEKLLTSVKKKDSKYAEFRLTFEDFKSYAPMEISDDNYYSFLHYGLRDYFVESMSSIDMEESYNSIADRYTSKEILKNRLSKGLLQKIIKEIKELKEDGQSLQGKKLSNRDKKPLTTATCLEKLKKMIKETNSNNNGRIFANVISIINGIDPKSLHGTDFSNKKLDGVDFSGADLLKTKFNNSSMKGSRIKGAKFIECDFQGVNFENSFFEVVEFTKSDMTDGNMTGAGFRDCKMDGVKASNAKFKACYMYKVDFTDATLKSADFSDAVMTSCKLKNTEMTNSIFTKARAEKLSVESVQLKRTNFTDAVLKESTFSVCEPERCTFNRTDFSKSIFNNLNFLGCSFMAANFYGTRLKMSKINESSLSDARFWFSSLDDLEVKDSDMARAQFQSCSMKKAMFLEETNVDKIVLGLPENLLEGHTESVLAVCFLLQETKQVETGSADGKKKKAAPSSSSAATSSSSTTKTDAASGDKSTSSSEKRSQYWLASAGCDATIRVWDLITGRLVRTLTGHEGYITCLSNVRRSESQEWRLASGSLDNTIRIWNVISGKEVKKIETFTVGVYSLCPIDFGSDEYGLASGDGDGKIRIWKTRKWVDRWDVVATLDGHEKCVNSLQQINLEVRNHIYELASGGADGKVFFWKYGYVSPKTKEKGDSTKSADKSGPTKDNSENVPKKIEVSGFSWKRSKPSSTNSESETKTRLIQGSVLFLCAPKISEVKQKLILTIGGSKKEIFSVKLSNGNTDTIFDGEVEKISFRKINKLTKSTNLYGPEEEDYDADNYYPDEDESKRSQNPSHSNVFANMAQVFDGPNGEEWLAAGCDDGTIRITSMKTKKEMAILRGHAERVYSVCAFKGPNDECWLASASADKTVRLWELADSRPPKFIEEVKAKESDKVNSPPAGTQTESEMQNPANAQATSSTDGASQENGQQQASKEGEQGQETNGKAKGSANENTSKNDGENEDQELRPTVMRKFQGGVVELKKVWKLDGITKKMFLAKGAVTFDGDFVKYCDSEKYTRFQAYHMAKCYQNGDDHIGKDESKSREWRRKYENAQS